VRFEDLMDFSRNRIYFIYGFSRPKNNKEVIKNERAFFRVPVRSAEAYEQAVEKLTDDCLRTGLKMYMYVSVNARDTIKAFDLFKRKLVEYETQALYGIEDFKRPLMEIDELWYSACAKPGARGTKYFLLDIDSKDIKMMQELWLELCDHCNFMFDVETKNGFHWVVTPFDVKLIEKFPDVSVQKDGLLYLGCTGFDGE
jgi:hypothetical protein